VRMYVLVFWGRGGKVLCVYVGGGGCCCSGQYSTGKTTVCVCDMYIKTYVCFFLGGGMVVCGSVCVCA
jgi:hypothetical protein